MHIDANRLQKRKPLLHAVCFFGLGEAAELAQRTGPRLLRRHAAFHIFFAGKFNM